MKVLNIWRCQYCGGMCHVHVVVDVVVGDRIHRIHSLTLNTDLRRVPE